jgi:RNA polymerase sigma factor (sigma-70 family)
MKPDRRDSPVQWLRSVMGQYEGALLRYAAGILGDVERGRDVVQETFLRLLKSDRGPADDHLAEWLFTVCRNRALDVYRKERRMRPLSEYAERSQPSREPAPPTAADQREQAGRVVSALKKLPPNQQEVLRLKFQNGFSYRQIAGITGLSVSNVGFLIHTGIQNLRKQFRAAGLLGGA